MEELMTLYDELLSVKSQINDCLRNNDTEGADALLDIEEFLTNKIEILKSTINE